MTMASPPFLAFIRYSQGCCAVLYPGNIPFFRKKRAFIFYIHCFGRKTLIALTDVHFRSLNINVLGIDRQSNCFYRFSYLGGPFS